MKNGSIALFHNHHGGSECRLYFPEWKVDDKTLRGVNLQPHRCDPAVCEYGDHMHVNVYDEPLRIVALDAVTLAPHQEQAITEYLRAQLAIDAMTHDVENFINAPATA